MAQEISVNDVVELGIKQRTVYGWKNNTGGKRFLFNLMVELLLLRAKHPKSAKDIQESIKTQA